MSFDSQYDTLIKLNNNPGSTFGHTLMKTLIRNASVSVWVISALALVLAGCGSGDISQPAPTKANHPIPGEAKQFDVQGPETKQPKMGELKRDAQLEAKLAAERDKKIKAIAAKEKDCVPVLEKLPRTLMAEGLVAYFQDKSSCSAAFSPDGRLLAIGSEFTIEVWDLQTGQPASTIKTDLGWRLEFSADSKTLASVGIKEVKLWDAQSGKEKRTIVHGWFCKALRFLPDGKTLATADIVPNTSGCDFRIKTWEFANGTLKSDVKLFETNPLHLEDADFSPDGQKLAVAIRDLPGESSKGKINVWRITDGALVRTKSLPSLYSANLAFSPDGWRLAVSYLRFKIGEPGTGPTYDGFVIDWNLDTDSSQEATKGANKVVYSPDGSAFFLSAFRTWSVPQQKLFQTPRFFLNSDPLAISPGGTFLYSAGGELWQADKLGKAESK